MTWSLDDMINGASRIQQQEDLETVSIKALDGAQVSVEEVEYSADVI